MTDAVSDTDWYLLDRAGRRYGPYDWPLVEQLVRDRELQPDTPVWHPGLAGWRRAESVLPFSAPRRDAPASTPRPAAVPATPPARKPAAAQRRKPRAAAAAAKAAVLAPAGAAVPPSPLQLWQRGLAGALDALLVVVALQAIVRFFPQVPFWVGTPRFALLAWAALGGWLLGTAGRTPGMALFAVTVTGRGGAKLDERAAWLRSAALPLLLLLMSLGAFFALIGAGVLFVTLARLRAGHPAWWDQVSGTTVVVGELTPARKALIAVAFGSALLVLALLLAEHR